MCAAGLKDPFDDSAFIRKDTWGVSDSLVILAPMAGLECLGVSETHQHSTNEGGQFSVTQIWRLMFCRVLAQGFSTDISSMH